MNSGLLSPRELCDLLNYVLGLPERIGKKTILRPAIYSCVVESWPVRPTRTHAERWCDACLKECGLGPIAPPYRVGRKPHALIPREVLPWAPAEWKRDVA